jgi:hypothetical protein
MSSDAYKFANEVLPLMLAEQAMGHDPVAPPSPPKPEPAPMPLPEEEAPLPAKAASFEAQLVQLACEKSAGLGGFLGSFGRGMLAPARPLIGLARGGLAGAGRGLADAGAAIAKDGVPAALGAAATLYAGSKMVRSPVITDSTGVRVRSPIHVPSMRLRSPIRGSGTFDGSGFHLQSPVKVLW